MSDQEMNNIEKEETNTSNIVVNVIRDSMVKFVFSNLDEVHLNQSFVPESNIVQNNLFRISYTETNAR